MASNPNPQGKGLAVVLRDLESFHSEVPIRPKSIQEVSQELFTSLFILHSDCHFTAIQGQAYYLYRLNGRYSLLMLGPDEWAGGSPGVFMGTCCLREDLTWTLDLSDFARNDTDFQEELNTAKKEFEKQLEASNTLEETLPFYENNMTYHQRVLAYALSKSLHASMELEGIAQLSYKEALKELK